jgi:hypothetical protein
MDKSFNLNLNLRMNNTTFPTENNSSSFLDKIFLIIEELYVYCHLKNYTTEESTEDKTIAYIIMVILVTIFSFTMFKLALVSIYFFFITVGCNIGRFFVHLFRNRLKIDILKEFKFACFYLGKIFKKLYTYNFYAYENKLLGICLVTLYLVFLSFNIMFTAEYMMIENKIGPEEEIPEKSDYVKVLKIVAFELSIFMELLCCTFYITRAIKNQFTLVCSSFLGLNLVVIGAVYYKMNLPDPSDENPRRCANLIFLTNFTILFIISAVKVTRYDLNCNY